MTTEVANTTEARQQYFDANGGIDDLVPVLKVECEEPNGIAYCDDLREVEGMLELFFGPGGEWETMMWTNAKMTITVVYLPESERDALEPFEGF